MREFAGFFLPNLVASDKESDTQLCEREWFVLRNAVRSQRTQQLHAQSLQTMCSLSHMWSNWKRLGNTFTTRGENGNVMDVLQTMHDAVNKLPQMPDGLVLIPLGETSMEAKP